MSDILVIDDDPAYGELTMERLESTGFSVNFFLGPFGSLNVIRQELPRLLILDVNMPGLAGTAVIDLLSKARGLTMADMRVLLYSSLDQQELDVLARAHGADLALNKSTPGDVFVKHVVRLMASSPRPSLRPHR